MQIAWKSSKLRPFSASSKRISLPCPSATELVEHLRGAKGEEIAIFRDAEVNVTMPSQIHHLSVGFTRCVDVPAWDSGTQLKS